MYDLDYSEFYITNVCNLNCSNCNHFNNFNFKGHERWSSYAAEYQQWAKIVNIKKIGILGGEPMLNPDFPEWVQGVADLWPNASISVITNGTQLHRWPEFYNILCKYKGRVYIRISEHDTPNKAKTFESVENFFPGECSKRILNEEVNRSWTKSYNTIKDPSWPDCNTPEEFINLPKWIQSECENQFHLSLTIWQEEVYSQCEIEYTNKDSVTVLVTPADSFYNSSINLNTATHELTICHSDPSKAIDVCISKKCHVFAKGKLHKCGPVGILPDFVKQFDVALKDGDLELINSYAPAQLNWTKEHLDNFIQNLTEELPVPQCTFCPEQLVAQKFTSSTKKIKLVKKP